MNQLGRILSRSFARRATSIENPGIRRRARLENTSDLKAMVADSRTSGLEEAEADFFGVHKMHQQYGIENYEHKEKIKSFIVKNKYFKVKFPNFLTWSEKEQIRYLHGNDKDEWTVEKLSDSFPADLFTIKKIIKSKWTPKDADRVKDHDDLVRQHWELLKQGKFTDLDPELQQHLQKFIHREFLETSAVPLRSEKAVDLFKPSSTEFINIILSSKKPKKSGNVNYKTKMIAEKATDEMHWKPPKKDMFLMPNIENDRPITYKQLSIENEEVSEPVEQPSGEIMYKKLKDNYTNNKTIVLAPDNDLKSVSKTTIRDHIDIPKQYWKRGGTFKVEDCYYDDDGEFLYRVPGMK